MLTLTLRRYAAYHEMVAEVAQSVEHSAENAGVASSILALGTPHGAAAAIAVGMPPTRRAEVAQW